MACSISIGVIYNSARIALSERSRELGSLRVLGYTRGEISYILLGELALIALAAIPLGFIIGYWLCAYIAQALASDLFRVPLIVEQKLLPWQQRFVFNRSHGIGADCPQ